MNNNYNNIDNPDIAWCPGCGNFSILKIVKETLDELNIKQDKLVFVSGIGQAAKIPQYLPVNYFNGLHGRALPAATGIIASNPGLTVILESGDGDIYGEGGNHFIHAIRRNPNITNIVHNNMIYGLTKGQASPTSQKGLITPVQVFGVILEPFNPLSVAISLGASFVARAFCSDIEQTKDVIKKAILNKGYSLVDIFQPCISFNKVNTFKWFKDNTYYLDENHDPYNEVDAFKKSMEKDKFPLGIIYKNKNRSECFEEKLAAYKNNKIPLYKREVNLDEFKNIIGGMK